MASGEEIDGLTATLVGPEGRVAEQFGGLLPSAAAVRGGETVVVALAVEHFADGAAVPLLVLSEAPGVLGIDPESSVRASDDAGRRYEVTSVSREPALGAARATLWLSPEVPSDARRLELHVDELTRTSPGRRGGGTAKPLSGGPWTLSVPLLPERTAVEAPERPEGLGPIGDAPKVPARAASAFDRLIPIGQARVRDNSVICLWGLEDYGDRAVLTLGVLTTERAETKQVTPGHGDVEVWDETGVFYAVVPVAGSGEGRWSETSFEITPSPQGANRLGVSIANLPGSSPRADDPSLVGPFTFGIALSDPT